MPSDSKLLRAHVGALFTQDDAGRLIRVNEPGGQPAPRFFLGQTTEGSEWWFRADLTEDTIQSLEAACAAVPDLLTAEPSRDRVAPFRAILERSAQIEAAWAGPAFHFPDLPAVSSSSVRITRANADLLKPYLESWSDDVSRGQTLYAVVIDGKAVSVCASVRESAAHEAGVETAPAFRGNGYAGQAVHAWAAAVRRMNKVPLYSTSWTNTGSLAVARKLNLVQFAGDLHFS
jgi:RimJ/RimL family protein N-acetyltransferase